VCGHGPWLRLLDNHIQLCMWEKEGERVYVLSRSLAETTRYPHPTVFVCVCEKERVCGHGPWLRLLDNHIQLCVWEKEGERVCVLSRSRAEIT